MKFKKDKIAKCQFRVPFNDNEYYLLEKKYNALPDEYKEEKSINMYLAEIFSKKIQEMQKQMDETNQITLTIDHAVTGTYSIQIYAMLYPKDYYSLDALSKYVGYSRVNMFRYLILSELN